MYVPEYSSYYEVPDVLARPLVYIDHGTYENSGQDVWPHPETHAQRQLPGQFPLPTEPARHLNSSSVPNHSLNALPHNQQVIDQYTGHPPHHPATYFQGFPSSAYGTGYASLSPHTGPHFTTQLAAPLDVPSPFPQTATLYTGTPNASHQLTQHSAQQAPPRRQEPGIGQYTFASQTFPVPGQNTVGLEMTEHARRQQQQQPPQTSQQRNTRLREQEVRRRSVPSQPSQSEQAVSGKSSP